MLDLTIHDPAALADLPGTTVVKFYATWCNPCKAYAPIFERQAAKPDYADLTFAQADVDAVPALRVIRGGQLIDDLNWPLGPKNTVAFLDGHAQA